jgi:hypothetical protein
MDGRTRAAVAAVPRASKYLVFIEGLHRLCGNNNREAAGVACPQRSAILRIALTHADTPPQAADGNSMQEE